ncbi:MAG: rRNA pseudouridine synthase [Rhizobiales bacterium]|nr:rRNA pseudouridine synthase [Hyphomicrobiales bacterium]
MTEPATEPKGERIAKRIARAGLCSRRDAERLIADGRVKVNGKVLETPAFLVTDSDKVQVDGTVVAEAEATRLWRYHKPSGLVTSHKDPEGRPTVFQKMPPELPRLISIGRLDLNTEGLLLLTNDGALARELELPSTGWVRRYRVRAYGRIEQPVLDGLKKGIEIDGVRYGEIDARLDKVQGGNVWIAMSLREGKNREIKKVLEHLGMQVNRLIRISYGPFQLGDLKRGEVKEVPRRTMREQLGSRLEKQEPKRTTKPEARRAPKGGKPNAHRRRKS